MDRYLEIFTSSFSAYWGYMKKYILEPRWDNFFYWLIGLSLLVWLLEILFPWRKNQSIIRKDFWLDLFYMFFNIFIFSLIGYYAISNVVVVAFNDFLFNVFGVKNLVAINLGNLPVWLNLILLFVIRDFIQWNTHRLLHRVPFLWKFHKVHHSVKEMGFAAHLRYHWIENIVYNTIQYLPLAMLGYGLGDYFIVYLVATFIGHLNHANINIQYGPFKYIFNSPQMHIWHHAKELPKRHGVNFGLSLSVWDYLFGTAYQPTSGKDIELGFEDVDDFPKSFWWQSIYPFKKK